MFPEKSWKRAAMSMYAVFMYLVKLSDGFRKEWSEGSGDIVYVFVRMSTMTCREGDNKKPYHVVGYRDWGLRHNQAMSCVYELQPSSQPTVFSPVDLPGFWHTRRDPLFKSFLFRRTGTQSLLLNVLDSHEK